MVEQLREAIEYWAGEELLPDEKNLLARTLDEAVDFDNEAVAHKGVHWVVRESLGRMGINTYETV